MIILKILFGLAVGAMIVIAFMVPSARLFPNPELARMIFFHLPCAISTPLFLFAGSYLSLRYLQKKDMKWDVRANAANEIGYILAILTMATGILFSKAQWGAWWQWDPRQTSFLLVLLLYAAYFALRTAFLDETRRALNAAAYSVIAVLPAIFLIFVFPRLPQIEKNTFHPNTAILDTLQRPRYDRVMKEATEDGEKKLGELLSPTQQKSLDTAVADSHASHPGAADETLSPFDYKLSVLLQTDVQRQVGLSPEQLQGIQRINAAFTKARDTGAGGFDRTYSTVLYTLLPLVLVLAIWIYRLRVRAGLLGLRLQEDNEQHDHGGNPAPTGVVRPVSLPAED